MKSCGMQFGCAAQTLAEKQQLEVRLRHLFYLALFLLRPCAPTLSGTFLRPGFPDLAMVRFRGSLCSPLAERHENPALRRVRRNPLGVIAGGVTRLSRCREERGVAPVLRPLRATDCLRNVGPVANEWCEDGEVIASFKRQGAPGIKVVLVPCRPGIVSREKAGRPEPVVHLPQIGGTGQDVVAWIERVIAKPIGYAQLGPGAGHDLHKPHSACVADRAWIARTLDLHDSTDPGLRDAKPACGFCDIGVDGLLLRCRNSAVLSDHGGRCHGDRHAEDHYKRGRDGRVPTAVSAFKTTHLPPLHMSKEGWHARGSSPLTTGRNTVHRGCRRHRRGAGKPRPRRA